MDNLGTKNLQRNLKGFSLDKSTQLRLFEKLEIKQILILKLATHVLLDLMWVGLRSIDTHLQNVEQPKAQFVVDSAAAAAEE